MLLLVEAKADRKSTIETKGGLRFPSCLNWAISEGDFEAMNCRIGIIPASRHSYFNISKKKVSKGINMANHNKISIRESLCESDQFLYIYGAINQYPLLLLLLFFI